MCTKSTTCIPIVHKCTLRLNVRLLGTVYYIWAGFWKPNAYSEV